MLKKFLYSKNGLITISIIFILFMVLVLPYMANLSEELTHSTFSPDTGLFYSIDEFYEAMMAYGQSGRNFYILLRWTFDLIWPLVYLGFFISISAILSIKYNKDEKRILFLPIAAVLLDLTENILATINVGIYPNRAVLLLRLLQVFSLLKWLAIALIMIKIIYLIIMISLKTQKIIHK